jgi:hypothetical protein
MFASGAQPPVQLGLVALAPDSRVLYNLSSLFKPERVFVMLEAMEHELELRKRIQDLLCDYSRAHYTQDYVEFTVEAVVEVSRGRPCLYSF